MLEVFETCWHVLTPQVKTNPNTHGLANFYGLSNAIQGVWDRKRIHPVSSQCQNGIIDSYMRLCVKISWHIMAHFSENILNQYKSLLVTYFIPSKSMGCLKKKNVDPPPSWGRHFYPRRPSARLVDICRFPWAHGACCRALLRYFWGPARRWSMDGCWNVYGPNISTNILKNMSTNIIST